MQVITIESEAYQKLVSKLDQIANKLDTKFKDYSLKERWLDNQEVCEILKISTRTLQSYRDQGVLPYSQNGAKIYYKATDIELLLERNYKHQ
ncbi:MAG: helix-turn-helix domain-containing protein [Bacteroidota bacterium]